MARLVNYGVGEIVDRLTILSLKILVGDSLGKEVTHFENEQAILLTQVVLRKVPLRETLALAAVNGRLWQAEDELRQMKGEAERSDLGNWRAAASCAFRIQDLNDARSRIMEAINRETGDFLGREKVSE